MILDDFMFHVSKVWYRIYWGLMLLVAVGVLGGSLAVRFVPSLHGIGETFYLGSRMTIALSALSLVYLTLGYWLIMRTGQAMATLLGTMINSLVLLNGVDNTPGGG